MKTEKLLGGLGALFIVLAVILAVIPVIGWVLGLIGGLIGLVFLFAALRAYSKFYKDSGIFNNFLIGFILSLIGIVVAWILGIGSLLLLLSEFSLSGFLFKLLVLYIIGILISFFYRKSLKSLNRHTGENLFGLAGNFMLIGAVLSIILIGTIIWLIGWILLAVAFFSLPEQV